jgi:hypothetical protein
LTALPPPEKKKVEPKPKTQVNDKKEDPKVTEKKKQAIEDTEKLPG